MTDRRLHPANARVAHESLRGQVDGVAFTAGTLKQIGVSVADLLDAPAGKRDRQCLFGEEANVLEDNAGFSFVQRADGYVGYIMSDCLSNPVTPTHRVATFGTHVYAEADFKSTMVQHLPFNARLKVVDERPKFYETTAGFVPKSHLRPLDIPFEDPATLAQLHFNVPYLWGGNSTHGIDCSGVITASLSACDISCPADSDLQREGLGEHVPIDTPLQRTDLVFWKGHVAMMVDDETLIHANAHHMACRYEPLATATLRIAAQGDGPVIARKRIL